jgi:GntR family transcriptional regulator
VPRPSAHTGSPAEELMPSKLGRGPKGRRLREILEGLVANLAPGSALPSERVLADRYGVARMTVRGEIDRLTADRLTYRVQGRGTFVAEARVAQALALSSFTEDMRARGMTPGSIVRARELVEASEWLALRLELAPGAAVMRLDRVRTADGSPLAVEQAYVPTSRYPGIEEADFADGSLFDVLADGWDVRLRDADQRVVAVAIEADDAEALEVASGSAGLHFQTLARDADGTPVYYAVSLYRGDRYEIDLRQLRER